MSELQPINTVAIVGSGNLAFHLADAFLQANKQIAAVVSRNPVYGNVLAKKAGCSYVGRAENCPTDCDLVVLAVSDSAIAEVAARLPQLKSLVVHISGSTPIDVLSRFEQFGVFYPLQSFTRDKAVNFFEIPILVEGNMPNSENKLKLLAHEMSTKVYSASTSDRKYLHLSAVFAANFTNALYGVSSRLMTENTHLPFELLLPLIKETATKLKELSPTEAQTGPARRGDELIINQQLDLLKNQPELQAIYKQLTALIQQTHHAKL